MAIPNMVMKFKNVVSFWILLNIFDLTSAHAYRMVSVKLMPAAW